MFIWVTEKRRILRACRPLVVQGFAQYSKPEGGWEKAISAQVLGLDSKIYSFAFTKEDIRNLQEVFEHHKEQFMPVPDFRGRK